MNIGGMSDAKTRPVDRRGSPLFDGGAEGTHWQLSCASMGSSGEVAFKFSRPMNCLI